MESKIIIEFTENEAKRFRSYFGKHDKTPFEHLAFKIFDDALKNKV